MLLEGYKNLAVAKAGILSLVSQRSWGAHFELEADVRSIFPYINAVLPDARYHDNPEYVIFLFYGVRCTLYPKDIVAAPFDGRESADVFATKLIGFLNDLNRRRNEITPNYRKYRPVSVIEIYRLLPRSNCRSCGYLSCMAFAAELSQGKTTTDQCPGFATPIYEYAVYPIYDNGGKLLETITIEKDPEKQKEMPDRALEISEASPIQDIKKGKMLGQPPLTEREREVLRLLSGGSTNNDISETLHISPHTVKSHVIHIFNKLAVNDRTQAAVIAAKYNLI